MNVLSRARSPERERALKIWLDSDRQKRPKDIAIEMNISDSIVRKWKSLDQWDNIPQSKRRGSGAPKGNQNAIGNKGGSAIPGNDNAVKHGLFRKFLPDDPETLEIFDSSDNISPLDMLWTSIRILWTNIVRSQKIMFVRDQQDETRVIKKHKRQMDTEKVLVGDEIKIKKFEVFSEKEWEYQHAWDKQASALTSQSTAMNRLASMIRQYEAMLREIPPEDILDEQRLRVEKLKIEVKKLNDPGDDVPVDDGFLEALKGKASEVWNDVETKD